MGAMRAVAAGGGAYTSATRAKAERKVAKATVEKQEARVSKARRVSGGQHFTKLSEPNPGTCTELTLAPARAPLSCVASSMQASTPDTPVHHRTPRSLETAPL